MSEKREKFVKLAEARVNKTLKDIHLIGNLSNRSAYDFSDDDVRKMFSALQKGLEAAKARYSKDTGSGGQEFRL